MIADKPSMIEIKLVRKEIDYLIASNELLLDLVEQGLTEPSIKLEKNRDRLKELNNLLTSYTYSIKRSRFRIVN